MRALFFLFVLARRHSAREVGDGLELHLVDLLGEAEAAQTLVEVRVQGIAANDGQRLGVPAEAVLEEERELRFAEWNVLVTRLQPFNDIGKNAQAAVDVLGFLQQGALMTIKG